MFRRSRPARLSYNVSREDQPLQSFLLVFHRLLFLLDLPRRWTAVETVGQSAKMSLQNGHCGERHHTRGFEFYIPSSIENVSDEISLSFFFLFIFFSELEERARLCMGLVDRNPRDRADTKDTTRSMVKSAAIVESFMARVSFYFCLFPFCLYRNCSLFPFFVQPSAFAQSDRPMSFVLFVLR